MTTSLGQRLCTLHQVTVVGVPACHFCDDAHTVLDRLAALDRIVLNTVDAESIEGQHLLGTHRPAMFPLVLVDGEFLSAGRLSRHRLANALDLAASEL